MITKDQLLDCIAQEADLCTKIYHQLPEGSLEFRLGDGMRNTLELLQYLSVCGIISTRSMLEKSWEKAGEWRAESDSMTAEEFPARMAAQVEAIREQLASLSDEDLATREGILPWQAPIPLGLGIVMTALRFLSVYRYQLFCHAKAAGNTELGTADAWLGQKNIPGR